MNKKPFGMFFFALLFLHSAGAQDWYLSNPAGMALQKTTSRTVALHSPWALSVEAVDRRNALPAILKPYDNASYVLEQRLLYERGALKRRQWLFRDAGGVTRVNASLPADLATIGQVEGGEVPPFIEVFSADRTLIETHQYLTSGKYTTNYSYRNGLLVKADSFLDSESLWSDTYRYTRSNLLRKVERVFYRASDMEAAQGLSNQPPQVTETPANLDLREAPPIPGFVSPGSPYDNSIMTEVLQSIYAVSAAKVVYDTDNQGRVIAETRYDSDDQVIAEITNEWAGDRIGVIYWSSGTDRGRIVFRYSGKDRISEEDYRNGELERTVKLEGNEEIEEIYMNGKPILRAIWQNGRKVSEERLR
jgi:antitoxin component YwqK of YwqJK toxin-antitoxin module